jgi:hypothetical protein
MIGAFIAPMSGSEAEWAYSVTEPSATSHSQVGPTSGLFHTS